MDTLPQNQAVDPLDREFAGGWRPLEGEKVRGRVVGVDLGSRDPDYGGGKYPILTLELLDGYTASTKDGSVTDQVALHCIHSQLAGKLAALEPKIGDVIGVKYLGEPVGSGRAKRYRVVRDSDGGGAPAGIDWSGFKFADDQAADVSTGVPLDTDGLEQLAETEQARQRERDELDTAVSEADDGAIPWD